MATARATFAVNAVMVVQVGSGWDKLAIAVIGSGVLWVPVRLSGRKGALEEDEHEETAAEAGG